MATADEITSGAHRGTVRPARDRVVHRIRICLSMAFIEGAAAAAITFFVAVIYHLAVLGTPAASFPSTFYGTFSLLAGLGHGTLAAFACARFLDGERRPQVTLLEAFYGWTAAIAVTLLTAFLAGMVGDLSRVSLTAAYIVGVPLLLLLRGSLQRYLGTRIASGGLQFAQAAVIGSRRDVTNFLRGGYLWRQGYHASGNLDLEDVQNADGSISLPKVADFVRRSLRDGAENIVLVGDLGGLAEIEPIVREIRRFALNVVYAPADVATSLKLIDVVPIGPNNAMRFARKPMSNGEVALKRTMDIVLSGLGLLFLAPFLALAALAIRLDTPGPILYRQARRGFNGETFMILKFRSMRVTESGFAMKQAEAGDARITRVGGLLRKTSIDELPQLWNVLRGQMSLVGPRPHAVSHDDELGERIANYAHRQRIKPGITGWAQVNGFRGETKTHAQVEGRVAYDIAYIENWSIFLDLWILVLTVVSPAARRNAR